MLQKKAVEPLVLQGLKRICNPPVGLWEMPIFRASAGFLSPHHKLKAILIPKDEIPRNNYLLISNSLNLSYFPLTIQKFFVIILIEKLKLFY